MTSDSLLNKNITFYNGSYGQIGQAAQTLANKDSSKDAKIQGLLGVASTVIGEILGNANADNDANSEADAINGKLTNLDNSKEHSAERNQENINKIISKVEENAKKLTDAIEKINKEEEKKKEFDEQLKTLITDLNTQKDIINNPNTKSEKNAARNRISAISTSINNLQTQVDSIQNSIQKMSELAENISDKNTKLNNNANDTIEQGIKEQEEFNAERENLVIENSVFMAKGSENTKAAIQAEAKAAEIRAGGTAAGILTCGAATAGSEALAVEQDMIAVANTNAAGTREIKGVKSNTELTYIGQNINNNTSTFNNLGTVVGSAMDDSNIYISGIIDTSNSIGSALEEIPNLSEESENINAALAETDKQLEQTNSNDNKEDTSNVKFEYEFKKADAA